MLLRCEKAAYTFPLKWNFFDDNWKWNKNIKKIDQLSRGSSWTLPLNSNHTFWSFSSSISFSCKFSTKKYGFYQNISKIDDEGVVEVERVDRERVKKFIKFPSLPSSHRFFCVKKSWKWYKLSARLAREMHKRKLFFLIQCLMMKLGERKWVRCDEMNFFVQF